MLCFSTILNFVIICVFQSSSADNIVNTTLTLVGEEPYAYVDAHLVSDERFLDAMEKAVEVCPNYRLCGDLADIYFHEDARLYERYIGLLEKQMNSPSPDGHSCCKPCSCDDSCKSEINCCSDAGVLFYNSTIANATTLPRNTHHCRSPILYNHRSRYILASLTITFMFYDTIVSCDVFTKQNALCDFPTSTFNDKVFVYSRETDLVYKNRHCAECNGQGVTDQWNLIAAECPANLYDLNMDDVELQKHVLHECVVINEPSVGLNVKSFACTEFAEEECNVAGEWKTSDPVLSRLCGYQYLSFVRDNITTYSNIYCYMCNQPSLFKVKPIECSEPLDTFWSEFGASPVYDLLTEEPTVLWRVMNEQNGAICPNGTFLDPVSDDCWPFYCPFDSRPLRGGCFPRLFSAREKAFEFSIFMQFLNRPSTAAVFGIMNDRRPLDFISNVFRQFTLSMNCEVFDWEIDVVMHVQAATSTRQAIGYIAKFRILETELCTVRELSRLNIRSQAFEYLVEKEILRTTINLFSNRPVTQDTTETVLVNIKQFVELGNKAVVEAPILYCPYLLLNESSLCRAFKQHHPCPSVTGHPLFSKFVEVHNLEFVQYSICVKDYMQIIFKANENGILIGERSSAAFLSWTCFTSKPESLLYETSLFSLSVFISVIWLEMIPPNLS